jgi:4-hydroxy-3-polyprenylbenzoate decarboxylase
VYKNLREFLDRLEKAGELKHIRREVSSRLEISRLTDRESKSVDGGAALFFERVAGSAFPVATNLFGSPRRICMALGVDHLDDLAERIRSYIEIDPPSSFREALSMLPLALDASRFFPRSFKGKTPPCQEIVTTGEAVDLSRLPVLHCWPKDAGAFITLPLVFTRSLKTGRQNLGMYRMQVFDKTTTGMHWHIHKDGSHYFNEYARAGKTMPVSVAIGADPATIYAATAPMPRGVDEILLAGFIRKQPVRMTRCVTNDLKVPAEAEFVLEGFVVPGELRREGPFGDHTGYYSLADDYPVFHVTALTHRKNPIYTATLVGRPPMEDCYLAKATERLFLPLLQTVMPEVRDYWLPWEGVFHNIVVVSLDKEYPGHAQKLMSGLWGQGQMSFCKAITVVDRDISPADTKVLIDLLRTRLDLSADTVLAQGVLDVLDHSAPSANFGAKIGIDLTRRFAGEPERRPPALPPLVGQPLDPAALRRKSPRIVSCRSLFAEQAPSAPLVNRFLAISVEKAPTESGQGICDELAPLEALFPYNVMVIYDRDIDLSDGSLLLWKLFNNVDPSRDMRTYGGRLLIDACKKGPADGHTRPWPDDLRFDEEGLE